MTKDYRSIIWLQTGFLGDIILNTGAFHLLRTKRPELKQFLVTTPIGAQALRSYPDLDGICILNKKNSSFASQIFQLKKDLKGLGAAPSSSLILQPHLSPRSSLLRWFLGADCVTFRQAPLSCLASHVCERIAVLHESERVALLLEPLGIDRRAIIGCRPHLTAIAWSDSQDWHHDIDGNLKLVALAPGSVWGTKRWPLPSFCQLADCLVNHRDDFKLLLLGSQAERQDCQAIVDHLKPNHQGRVLNLAGKTSLLDLRVIYPRLSMVITNDSSPVHYASGFNIPTVAFFGATVPAMGFAPLADRSIVIENPSLDCRPCGAHGPQKCPLKHFQCMATPADQAAKLIYPLLDQVLTIYTETD